MRRPSQVGWRLLIGMFRQLFCHCADPRKSDATSKVDALDEDFLTPLLWATESGHLQVMRLLIEAKASKDATNKRQETPLFMVATNGYATGVRVLTDAGADMEKADESGYTPLHSAAENGHLEAVHVLIDAGARVDLNLIAMAST